LTQRECLRLAPRALGRGIAQNDGELLTAVTAGDVAAADTLLEQRAELLEHSVPGLVPERIVDPLEVIDVDDDRASGLSLRLALSISRQKLSQVALLCSPVSGSVITVLWTPASAVFNSDPALQRLGHFVEVPSD